MKKWIPVLAAAMMVTFATGCQSKGNAEADGNVIEAMYIEKGENFQIFVDISNGAPFTATIPEGTEELTTGDLVKIYGNGIMLESYPGQYPGVTKIEVTAQGEEEDADQYEELLSEIYVEPDPSETPSLNLEYTTKLGAVTAMTDRGGVSWTYEKENGQRESYVADCPFILDWKVINDIRLGEPTDVKLSFSKEPEKVQVIRYEREESEEEDTEDAETESTKEAEAESKEESVAESTKDSEKETGKEADAKTPEDLEGNTTEDSESKTDSETETWEQKGEEVVVTEEKDDTGRKQYFLKGLVKPGVYLVKVTYDQGTVEYGFEVLPLKELAGSDLDSETGNLTENETDSETETYTETK